MKTISKPRNFQDTNLVLRTKRIYETATPYDGYRVLVDRLWPRGVSKQAAVVDLWLKDIAPSPDLRIWFGHKPELFEEFSARYLAELQDNPAVAKLTDIMASNKDVTLLYAAHDSSHNHANVLLKYINTLPNL